MVAGVVVVVEGGVGGGGGPYLTGDLEGGLLVGALEGEVLGGADPVEGVAILLLEAAKLLNQLVLVEVDLELVFYLVVEGGGVVVMVVGESRALAGEFQKALEELDLVIVGPEALEEAAGVVGGGWGWGRLWVVGAGAKPFGGGSVVGC